MPQGRRQSGRFLFVVFFASFAGKSPQKIYFFGGLRPQQPRWAAYGNRHGRQIQRIFFFLHDALTCTCIPVQPPTDVGAAQRTSADAWWNPQLRRSSPAHSIQCTTVQHTTPSWRLQRRLQRGVWGPQAPETVLFSLFFWPTKSAKKREKRGLGRSSKDVATAMPPL